MHWTAHWTELPFDTFRMSLPLLKFVTHLHSHTNIVKLVLRSENFTQEGCSNILPLFYFCSRSSKSSEWKHCEKQLFKSPSTIQPNEVIKTLLEDYSRHSRYPQQLWCWDGATFSECIWKLRKEVEEQVIIIMYSLHNE